MALARLGAFRGRMLLAGMTAAPIVMPEVITGRRCCCCSSP